jgi:hypothetical protein
MFTYTKVPGLLYCGSSSESSPVVRENRKITHLCQWYEWTCGSWHTAGIVQYSHPKTGNWKPKQVPACILHQHHNDAFLCQPLVPTPTGTYHLSMRGFDNIDAAFRHILYAPDMAVLFAYMFGKFLIIPMGQVFGSHSAPSFSALLWTSNQTWLQWTPSTKLMKYTHWWCGSHCHPNPLLTNCRCKKSPTVSAV